MDVQAVIFLYGVLAIVGIFILAWFGLMFAASRISYSIDESYRGVRRRLSPLDITAA